MDVHRRRDLHGAFKIELKSSGFHGIGYGGNAFRPVPEADALIPSRNKPRPMLQVLPHP